MTEIEVSSPRLRRNRALALAVKTAAWVLVAVAVGVSYFALLFAILNLSDQQQQERCRGQLFAYVFLDVAKAFNASPGDKVAVAAAVLDITRAAERYADADKVCASGGRPDPLPPTPVPTEGATR